MNDDLRQRVIDSIGEAELRPKEKETTIRFAKDQDRIRIFSAETSIMRRLIAHPEFEVETIRQKTSDGKIDIEDQFEEQFDGRRKTVNVMGTMPIGILQIKSKSPKNNSHAGTVSIASTDLRLSQREGDK